MTSRRDPASSRGTRTARLLFAGMALVSLSAGLAFYALAERLGLDDHTARYLATAFLVAAVADALILYFWDRVFTSRR
jgi:hypothetical protein